VTPDAVALAAALAQPWATIVLSGAVTPAQLTANLAALRVTSALGAGDLGMAEPADAYWSARAARSWT
jgi:aryl-alcohol dehydrogenase-like predicted oxidoreductase